MFKARQIIIVVLLFSVAYSEVIEVNFEDFLILVHKGDTVIIPVHSFLLGQERPYGYSNCTIKNDDVLRDNKTSIDIVEDFIVVSDIQEPKILGCLYHSGDNQVQKKYLGIMVSTRPRISLLR